MSDQFFWEFPIFRRISVLKVFFRIFAFLRKNFLFGVKFQTQRQRGPRKSRELYHIELFQINGDVQLQEDVTILFADIVGFTRLSSGLSAAKLVNLLNDLFGRFDYLCDQMACEKVATLGDCYYCVSGCPEPDPNHAFNCVKMGLKERAYKSKP